MSDNTARIEFVRNDNGVKQVRRLIPAKLRGLLMEDDFERFCEKVDVLLEDYDVSEPLFLRQMIRFFFAIFTIPVGFFIPNPYSSLIGISWGICFVWVFIFCWRRLQYITKIHTSIQMECVELTNRTGTATFQLVPTSVFQEENDVEIWEFRHVDVLISDKVTSF